MQININLIYFNLNNTKIMNYKKMESNNIIQIFLLQLAAPLGPILDEGLSNLYSENIYKMQIDFIKIYNQCSMSILSGINNILIK